MKYFGSVDIISTLGKERQVCALSKISFNDVMNFSHKHNISVYHNIVAAQKNGSLIPFVGAGMSIFCGYKPWGDVLCDLAEFIQEDMKDERQKALKQIENGAYQDAAQTILEAYPQMLRRLPSLVSPDKINNCPPEKLQASAVYVLPYLFQNGLVMTTNFDRVLETAYRKVRGHSIETVTPNQQDLLEQLRQKSSLGLFKLHGDIGSGTVSIDDLVFTGEQYEKKYADGSPLVRELTRWFENRTLLFLGCSLNADRTMDVLKDVTRTQPGLCHYAILGCKKSEITKRLREMDALGIEPLLYDNSNHDAVRVILERLLEDTDQSSFKKLWEVSRVPSAEIKEERRLLFDADYFPFIGRKQELKSLEDFCASHENISWWAVTGPGGMGKSRLVYEFTNQKHTDGWQIERFEARPSKDSRANPIQALSSWVPETSRTIVVLDDVQANMELVRRWLKGVVHRPRSEKLRILLLEREGKDLNSSSWLGAESCDDIPNEWCHDDNFLYLEPMTNVDLISIMDNYAAAAGQKLNAEPLLKTLERVDPKLMRPLYAVAIADARCQGKDPTSWDRKQVLDTLLARELNFHFSRFQGMTGEKITKTLRSEMKELLARSCAHGLLFLDDAEMERYPKLVKKMNDVDMDLQEFLEGLGILRTIQLRSFPVDHSGNPIAEPSEERRKVIALSCPDLIKEHLVLNLAIEGGKMELLFPQGWEQDQRQLFFLGQLLVDYSDRLKEQPNYWKTFFRGVPMNLIPAEIYGNILWGYTIYYPNDARTAVDRLAQLYDEMKHPPEIAVAYARGLFNLNVEQDLKGRTETATRLDELYQNHPDIPEAAVTYAKGLFNLTVDQDLIGCTETVTRLDELYQNHLDIPEVAVEYAKGLVNLTAVQDLMGCTETVARLDELCQNHLDIPEVAVAYANGLRNLTVAQDLIELTESVARLEELYQNHPDIPKVTVAYAKGLHNLTAVQDLIGCTETVARLDELYQNHPDTPDVAVAYVKGLVNLTAAQDLIGCTETVARLEEFYQNHPDTPEVAVAFAKGLVNLTAVQDLMGRTETVARIDELYQNNPDIPDVMVAYANGLSNLSATQDLIGCTETVTQLDRLYQNHPDIPEVAARFAGSLVSLALHQKSESEVRSTLARSSAVLDRYPKNSDIQLAHAMTWFNLTLQQCEADIPATVTDIVNFLRSNAEAIPKFKEALDKYLFSHSDHAVRYQPLLDL